MLYFDHSATTPLHPDVFEKMQTVAQDHFGNPSSIHSAGRKSRVIIESARQTIAASINAEPSEIVFAGSGTEANNAVLWSLAHTEKKHVVTSAVEHPAVLKVLKKLEPFGVTFTALPVDDHGLVNPIELEKAIQPNTGLISIMMVNNEVGTINPMEALVDVAQTNGIPFHSDTVQALGKTPLSVREIPADYFSFSAHKLYGPKGVGFLYKRKGSSLNPLIIGGGQERNLRAGTENVPGIAGIGEAVRLATQHLDKRRTHLTELESTFKSELAAANVDPIYNGHPDACVPGVISASFPGQRSDILLAKLDRENIAVSSGSACGSGSVQSSPVLEAMGISEKQNMSTLRISFGRGNTIQDVNTLVSTISNIING